MAQAAPSIEGGFGITMLNIGSTDESKITSTSVGSGQITKNTFWRNVRWPARGGLILTIALKNVSKISKGEAILKLGFILP